MADQGHLDSIHNLGYCYETGTGVEKDAVLAVELYRRAADQAQQHQALADFQAGLRVQSRGKPHVARIYYHMALRRATGDLNNQIARQIEGLDATQVARNTERK